MELLNKICKKTCFFKNKLWKNSHLSYLTILCPPNYTWNQQKIYLQPQFDNARLECVWENWGVVSPENLQSCALAKSPWDQEIENHHLQVKLLVTDLWELGGDILFPLWVIDSLPLSLCNFNAELYWSNGYVLMCEASLKFLFYYWSGKTDFVNVKDLICALCTSCVIKDIKRQLNFKFAIS